MNRILTLICFLISLSSTAQSISLYTLNIGGGSFKSNNIQVDWSVAEGASVKAFTEAGGLLVKSGILQPFTLKNEVAVFNGSSNWLATEIVSYPVPTQNTLQIDIKVAESGRMNLQFMDGNGKIFITRSFDYNKTNGLQRFDLSGLPSGTYYLNATLSHPLISVTKRTGTFKIIKQ